MLVDRQRRRELRCRRRREQQQRRQRAISCSDRPAPSHTHTLTYPRTSRQHPSTRALVSLALSSFSSQSVAFFPADCSLLAPRVLTPLPCSPQLCIPAHTVSVSGSLTLFASSSSSEGEESSRRSCQRHSSRRRHTVWTLRACSSLFSRSLLRISTSRISHSP